MVVENTAAAVTAAVRSGADIVEIDVVGSTDGDFFVFHDGYEPLHFVLDRNLRTLGTAEIEALRYGHGTGVAGPPVERLETVLRSFPGVLFNIDRSWWYWDRLLPWLDGFDLVEQLILKSPVQSGPLAALRDHPTKYPYFAIVTDPDQLPTILEDPKINLVGVELHARTPQDRFCDPAVIAGLHERGLFVFVNALDLGNGVPLMAGWDDTRSVLDGPSEGWGRLVDLGVDVIQTDWPWLLDRYLTERSGLVADR